MAARTEHDDARSDTASLAAEFVSVRAEAIEACAAEMEDGARQIRARPMGRYPTHDAAMATALDAAAERLRALAEQP